VTHDLFGRICAERACNIPRKWSFGKKNMPSEKEKHGIRHIICLGRDAEGRKVCLRRRKSME